MEVLGKGGNKSLQKEKKGDKSGISANNKTWEANTQARNWRSLRSENVRISVLSSNCNNYLAAMLAGAEDDQGPRVSALQLLMSG